VRLELPLTLLNSTIWRASGIWQSDANQSVTPEEADQFYRGSWVPLPQVESVLNFTICLATGSRSKRVPKWQGKWRQESVDNRVGLASQ
jgi:hypothetical protein